MSFFYFGLLFLEIMVNVSTTNFGYHVMYFGVLREEKKVESILLLYVWDAEVRNIQRDYSFIYGLIFRH